MSTYEECMRIPLMIRLPGAIHPGTVCEHPVALVDLPPTFFSFADVRLPWPMHGHNLRPILENPSSPWDYPVLLEHFAMSFGPDTDIGLTSGELFSDVPWWISLRKDHYKYIRTLEPNELEELYDLVADPAEDLNVALDAKMGSLLARYRAQMIAELTRTGAGLVSNLPSPRRGDN